MIIRLFLLLSLLAMASAEARTNVRITTPVGAIDLELYDDEKPITVANFLRYIREGRYVDTIAHRLEPGFVIQGGSFTFDPAPGGSVIPGFVPLFDQIVNEFSVGPYFPNVYGTIAMAKLGGNPDSATAGWFINLGDNSAGRPVDLDNQNGGFTVFGRVTSGIEILEILNIRFSDADLEDLAIGNATDFLIAQFPPPPTEDQVTFANNFGQMPLAQLRLSPETVFTTRFEILEPTPEPTPEPEPVALAAPALRIGGPKKLQTRRPVVTIRGQVSDATRVEWRLGKKGRYKKAAGNARWRVRAGNLPVGRSVLFIRAIGSDQQPGRAQKVRVVRK